ncbi:unnamed protein product [Rhodiola kirilowii]
MGAAESATATVNAADQDKFGFKRPDMYKESLTGTIAAYDRHVFLCYKGPDSWGPRVESSAPLPLLPAYLFAAFKARKNDMSLKTNLTVCGPASGDDLSDGDVLIFPDMIRYRGLQEADVDSFIEDVLVNNMNWGARPPESFSGTYVFVCAHGSRDKRCGVCGPVLIDSLNEEIVSRQLTDEVHISPCSHIGGHKYAGNLIIYNPDRSGKVAGHWYGYVTPEDVPEVLDSHIKMGKIIQRMWRGQMGSAEEKLADGDGSASKNNNPKIGGCCQSVEGVSCCAEGISKEKITSGGSKIEEGLNN